MISRSIQPMVGRQHEMEIVMDRYKAAEYGYANVLLVAGEPGIGKTRFLNECATYAVQEGAVVLRGGASTAEGMPPYQPFLEALGRYIEDCPLEQVATMPQVFKNLFPELALRFGEHSKPQKLSPEARFRLYEATGKFLEIMGAAHAVVLILDDLHWADIASFDLLNHIARRQSHAHLLILGAYRNSEIECIPALNRTVAELTHQRLLTTITVDRLSESEIKELVTTHLTFPPSPNLLSLLYNQCEGNPFFAEELLDYWVDVGALAQKNNEWDVVSPHKLESPPSLIAVLRQRFERLKKVVIDHLRVAAVIGRRFDLSLLATVEKQEVAIIERRFDLSLFTTVEKQEVEAVEEILLEAERSGLVRASQSGNFTFSHDKIRECLYVEVSTSRRKRLHGIIGRILETQFEPVQTMNVYQLSELAFHFARSDDRTQGIEYSLHAASQAMQTFAFEEAISHYQIALELLSPMDNRYGDFLLSLGEANLLAGKDKEAETAYEAAQRWLVQNGSREATAQAAHGLGRAYWRQEKRAEALTALLNALELLNGHQCADAVEVMLDLSILLTVFMSQYAEGTSYGQQALAMARDLGDSRLEVTASRIVTGNLSIQVTELPSASQFLQRVLVKSEENGDLLEAAECSLYLAGVYYWLAEIKNSMNVCMHMIDLIKHDPQPYLARNAYAWHTLLLASQGKWEEAEQMIELAHPIVDHFSSPLPSAFLCQMRGFLAYQREHYLLAESELQAAMVGQEQWSSLGESTFYFGLLGLTQAQVGKREDAHTDMARLERFLDTLPLGIPPTAPLIMCQALTALVLGDNQQASRLYSRLLAFQGQHYWFLADRVLGMIATIDGAWEKAMVHLRAAEKTARREYLQPELARALLGLADVEVRRGGRGSAKRARSLLDEAFALFTALDMVDSIQATHKQLRALSGRPTEPLPSKYPNGLTKREVEIIGLIANGQRSHAIAEELGLAQRTVDNRLTEIYFKIHAKSRGEAVAYAVRHGLV